MSFRLANSSRLLLRQTVRLPNVRPFVRYSSSVEGGSQNEQPPKQEPTPVQKTLEATKAYIEKFQHDMKPKLEPYIAKLNHTSQQLKRLTSDISDSKEALQRVSRALNEVTGYDQIDAVKHKVNNQAVLFENTRDEVQAAKRAYEAAIETRSATQRGINELLQRKHMWTGDDVTKFTELYRLEHSHSQAEILAKEKYQACEKQMDREYMELARSIMERYHEEQLWSDKIRSVSTYGTWALMVVNLLLFVAVQTVFEPRKRRRLTDRFEELLVAKVAEEEEKFKGVFESLDEKDRLLMAQQVAVMEALNALAEHPLFDEETVESLKRTQRQEGALPVPVAPVLPKEEEEIQEQKQTRFMDFKREKVELDNDQLYELLILAPANFDNAPFYKEEKKATAIPATSTDDSIVLSKRNLALYSMESAVVGGLVAAVAMYFFR